MTKKTSFYSILIFLMLSIFSSGISAKKKIVLLPFEYKVNKKSGKAVRKFIQKILKNNYEYITKKTIKETMGKDVDWDNVTPEQLKEISGKFMITAYVGGTIKKVKRKFVFVPRLLSWETGENIISKEFKFKRYNLSKKEIELIAMAYLQGIEGLKEYEAPKIEPVKPEVKQVIEEEKPEEIVKKPVALKALDKKKDADWAPLPSLRAGLKLFFMNRALDFTPASEPYYKTAGLSAAPGWDIEVFPMGFKDPTSPLAGIGLKFSGYMMPGFESYPADDEASKVDTSVYEIGFDLVYRYRVLKNLVVRE
ncbi:MAG: hypothetical protein JXR95_07105, partial [Deltaproteobacteria bacterium]|nr:hypothetical protein [Deltaproteobacteria bacterium]